MAHYVKCTFSATTHTFSGYLNLGLVQTMCWNADKNCTFIFFRGEDEPETVLERPETLLTLCQHKNTRERLRSTL